MRRLLACGLLLVAGCADADCGAEASARELAGPDAIDCGSVFGGDPVEEVVACIEDADAREVAVVGAISDGAIEAGELWLVRSAAGHRAWFVYRSWGEENRGGSCLGPFERPPAGTFGRAALWCRSSDVVELCPSPW